MHTVLVIFLTGLIADASGKIQNAADSNSVLLQYQANHDVGFQEVADKYMKEFYERVDEFRKTRKYKEGKVGELVSINREILNDNQVDSTIDDNENDNEDPPYKNGAVFGGWLPLHPPPPAPPPEKQWGRSDINDYFNVGHQSEKSIMKKRKLSKIDESGHEESRYTNDNDVQMRSMTLHPSRRPFFNFTVNSNSTLYIFEVPHDMGRNYLLSVVVEKMNCRVGRNNFAKLYIGGENGESHLCKEIDDATNHFQSVSHVFDGDGIVNVTGTGDWTTFNVSANLVVSIYYETSSCALCDISDHFCCGRKENSCNSIPSKKTRTTEVPLLAIPKVYDLRRNLHQQHFRCIPKEDANGTSLLCNGHPNCGFHCNLDELKGNCPKKDEDGNDKDDDNNCMGYYCREYGQDRVLVTILLLVLFCVFVPFCIFLFLCGRRDMRRELGTRGRCPLPLEILFCPFSMSSDSVPEGAAVASNTARGPNSSNQTRRQQRVRGNGERRTRRSEEVNPPAAAAAPSGMDNFSFFDDLPPSYAECIGNKELYPNPLTLAELPPPPPPPRVGGIPGTGVPPATATTVILVNARQDNVMQLAPVPTPSTASPLAVSSGSQETAFAELHSPQAISNEDSRSSRHVCQCSKHRNPVIVEESEAELRESESSRRGQAQRRIGDVTTRY